MAASHRSLKVVKEVGIIVEVSMTDMELLSGEINDHAKSHEHRREPTHLS